MTRNRILVEDRQLFFEKGIANVSLQQIADRMGISVGNLAYHYNSKQAIVNAVYKEVFEGIKQMLNEPLKQKNLTDFDVLFEMIYQFVNTHRFCFNNVWEIARNYSDVQKKWETLKEKLLQQTHSRIDFHVNPGVLKKDTYKEASNQLAQHLLLNFHFGIPQQFVRGKTATLSLFKKSLWSLVYHHLTEKGLSEYKEVKSQ